MESPVPTKADPIAEPRRWLRIVEWILFALLAGQTGVKTLPSAWRTLNTDFSNYYLTRASTQLPWRRIVLINVFEMSFLPNGDLIFTASLGRRPGLFTTDQAGSIRSLGMDDGRYPSVSPDGHWLASSHLQSGN